MTERRRIDQLDLADRNLVAAALSASARAYAPYSGFAVGAAVRTGTGAIFSGANLENASYGMTICAEMSAVATANTAAVFNLKAIAVVGHKFSSPVDAGQVVTPCGRCRQIIFEAAQISKTDISVLSCSGDLQVIDISTISELLPSAFGPHNLGLDETWVELSAELEARVRILQGLTDST